MSGIIKNSQRPALQKLLHLAHTNRIDKVVVSEVSRLGRNTREVLETIEERSKAGVSIYIQNYHLETFTPHGEEDMLLLLEENKHTFEQIFLNFTQTGVDSGEIPAEKDLVSIASMFFTLYNGLRDCLGICAENFYGVFFSQPRPFFVLIVVL
ncbi:MAG: recombinase family protein [Bacteroidota bacterium]